MIKITTFSTIEPSQTGATRYLIPDNKNNIRSAFQLFCTNQHSFKIHEATKRLWWFKYKQQRVES